MVNCEFCPKSFDTQEELEFHMQKSHNPSLEELPKEPKTKPKMKKYSRDERVPFGTPMKRFNIPKDDGYHYRVFNDNWKHEPQRIERAKMAGYEIWDGRTDDVAKTAGTNDDGSEIKGVVMRIPKELYEEDQARKQEELEKIDNQIYSGKFQQGKNDRRYFPGGGIKHETKLTG